MMLIGGRNCMNLTVVTTFYTKTFIYDFLIDTWTNRPELSFGRAGLGCTSFTDEDDINWTIISGGLLYYPDDYKLTQVLKENSNEWTDVEINLPLTFADLKLINFMGKAMLIEGIISGGVRISGTDIYELEKSANGQFTWILSDLSLKYNRTTSFTL